MKKLSLSLLCIIHFSCLPVIVESNKLATILSYIQSGKNNLVILDLDNTIVTASTDAGSDQWFTHKLVERKKPFDKTLQIYFKLQDKISLEFTEPDVLDIFAQLAQPHVTVIGLTARSPELEPRTISELNRLGIHFSHILSHDDVVDRRFHYHSGVVFAGGRDKGVVSKDILEDANLHPDNVIMVDDKHKNITPVEKAVEALGIKFIGIRYGGMDERVKNFDPIRAKQEKRLLLGN